MKLPGVPYRPRYTSDEIVLGVTVAIALHLLAIGPFVYRAIVPAAQEEDEKPLVARPVVQAALLKLGKPLDPNKLPDRLVPQKRTAPKKTLTASADDPAKKLDAGAPPPNVTDSDLTNLIAKSDPFAEDAGKVRPEEGHPGGVDGGTETDPNKVRAGDMYAMQLSQFFGQRLTLPTVISPADEKRLCAVFEFNIGRNMVIWYVKSAATRPSGNELFDDSVRSMLLKLLEDKTALPAPPPEVDEQYRGRRIQINIVGPHGDPSRCK